MKITLITRLRMLKCKFLNKIYGISLKGDVLNVEFYAFKNKNNRYRMTFSGDDARLLRDTLNQMEFDND